MLKFNLGFVLRRGFKQWIQVDKFLALFDLLCPKIISAAGVVFNLSMRKDLRQVAEVCLGSGTNNAHYQC